MELGSKNRSVGATLMNVDSSRSHSIFTINIEMMEASIYQGRKLCKHCCVNIVCPVNQLQTQWLLKTWKHHFFTM